MLMFDILGQEADGTFAVCAPGCTKYETYLVNFFTPLRAKLCKFTLQMPRTLQSTKSMKSYAY